MSRGANRGTGAVLLADLLATLGAVAFAIAYEVQSVGLCAHLGGDPIPVSSDCSSGISLEPDSLMKGRSPSLPQVQS